MEGKTKIERLTERQTEGETQALPVVSSPVLGVAPEFPIVPLIHESL